MTKTWVVSVGERRCDVVRTYQSPPHECAADARALAAIILGRPALIGDGPWWEAIAGGHRTVRIDHLADTLPA